MRHPAVIPLHPKDSATLPLCVAGLRENVKPLEIILIAPRRCEDLANQLKLRFVDEDTLVPGVTAGLYPEERWGWYFQQLLKLGAHTLAPSGRYLVVDSDTVFLRPVEFEDSQGIPLYATSREHHQAYYDVFEFILGMRPDDTVSYVTHHMLFDAVIVREMLARFGPETPWWANVVRYRHPMEPWNSGAQFAEYETYGHYLEIAHPHEFEIRPLRWTTRPKLPSDSDLARLARSYDFCTFHEHMRRRGRPAKEAIIDHVRMLLNR